MSRILVAVLSLAALGFLAYRAMYGQRASLDGQAPQQQLQNVRDKAHDFEQQGQQHVDDVEKKTTSE
jgi:hypothetical protein